MSAGTWRGACRRHARLALSFDEVIVTTFTAAVDIADRMLTELIRPRQRPVTNVVLCWSSRSRCCPSRRSAREDG
jgi:hypothetical protein